MTSISWSHYDGLCCQPTLNFPSNRKHYQNRLWTECSALDSISEYEARDFNDELRKFVRVNAHDIGALMSSWGEWWKWKILSEDCTCTRFFFGQNQQCSKVGFFVWVTIIRRFDIRIPICSMQGFRRFRRKLFAISKLMVIRDKYFPLKNTIRVFLAFENGFSSVQETNKNAGWKWKKICWTVKARARFLRNSLREMEKKKNKIVQNARREETFST